jgi:hypothetical protein
MIKKISPNAKIGVILKKLNNKKKGEYHLLRYFKNNKNENTIHISVLNVMEYIRIKNKFA